MPGRHSRAGGRSWSGRRNRRIKNHCESARYLRAIGHRGLGRGSRPDRLERIGSHRELVRAAGSRKVDKSACAERDAGQFVAAVTSQIRRINQRGATARGGIQNADKTMHMSVWFGGLKGVCRHRKIAANRYSGQVRKAVRGDGQIRGMIEGFKHPGSAPEVRRVQERLLSRQLRIQLAEEHCATVGPGKRGLKGRGCDGKVVCRLISIWAGVAGKVDHSLGVDRKCLRVVDIGAP